MIVLDQAKVLATQRTLIKAEAGRRILHRFPEWKQLNMTARQAELARIQAGLMRDADGTLLPARTLSAEEAAEEAGIARVWAWIKAVRVASDTLEQTPPQDFADDAHWPSEAP